MHFTHVSLALVLWMMRCEAIPHDYSSMKHVHQPSRELQTTSCSADEDCTSGDYCNRGICRPGGYCENALDCHNPSNMYSMIECLGFLYCSIDNECQVECAGSHCPNYDEVDCRENPPCNNTECSEDYVSCINDDCGGCNARFFTASGEQACVIEGDSVEPDCSSDMDCADGMYCSNGQCSADECSSEDTVQCYAQPCDVTTCTEEVALCVDSTCGECIALFYNAAGERLCEDAQPNAGCGKVDPCEQTDSWEKAMCEAKVFLRTRMCRLLQN